MLVSFSVLVYLKLPFDFPTNTPVSKSSVGFFISFSTSGYVAYFDLDSKYRKVLSISERDLNFFPVTDLGIVAVISIEATVRFV